MITHRRNMRLLITIVTLCLLLTTSVPLTATSSLDTLKGMDKGVSYKPVIPLKKTTFVNYDENSFLDDYAYLAAVPTAVFTAPNHLISYPLLFYQDAYPVTEDKERSLNARQGLDYFMDDWMTYCNGQLDQMTLINVPRDKAASTWNAANITTITGTDPYDLADQIALNDWSYANAAVVAVIEPQFKNPATVTQGTVSGSVPAYGIGTQQFPIEEPVIGTGGTYHYFDIKDEHYKYVVATLTWPDPVDYDLQLYDTTLGMLDNAAHGYPEESREGFTEVVGAYIHNHGKWGVSVTAVPVKSADPTTNTTDGMILSALRSLARSVKNQGTVDLRLYPGTMVTLPASPFGCRDVDITLTWPSTEAHLGLTLLDPTGTEICSSLSKEELTSGETTTQETEENMHVDRLGECRPGENYSLCIYSLGELSQPMDFTVQYTWHQNFSWTEAASFAAASNGAVLASALNAPLLYASPTGISTATRDVLLRLGVSHIYLIDLGGNLTADQKTTITNVAPTTVYSSAGALYTAINQRTGNSRASVFTTIDPWTYWYVAEDKPAGEYPAALFVGPAAFIAAQHGCPVLIVDFHPQLSQATVYPTDFWVKGVVDRIAFEPTSGSMLLSGREVYSFLEEYGLGKLEPGGAAQQNQEILITVADQYDIGSPWDRMFTGAALNGRFTFSPVDTAYWISRDVFYPAMIYVNPAMKETTLINGSTSKAKVLTGRLRDPVGSTLVITKQSQEESYTYPILETFNTYAYRFNENAWKYWDFKYTTADGIIPYETPSPDPIDDGVTDKAGAYYPDMSESEVIPFYATKAGYDNVYSTNFDAAVEDLNRGVLIWVENCHGWGGEGGLISMWDTSNPYIHEENPWRAYEPILLKPGHYRDFLHYIVYALTGHASALTKELIKFHIFPEVGSTQNPDVSAVNVQPLRMRFNGFIKKLGFPIDFWSSHGIVVYWNRLRHPLQYRFEGLPIVNFYGGDGKVTISPRSGQFTMKTESGIDFDNALENLHSCGLNTISCLPAYSYLHMTWLRHGMAYQIIDPWTTTDWAGIWTQMLIKRFAMGDTLGQAYERGMRACGPEFLVGQWWWDKWENVELFGDPCLRVYVPGTNYSANNHWEQGDTMALPYQAGFSVDGHAPFGTTQHPNAKAPASWWQWWMVAVVAIVIIVVIAGIALVRRKP